MIGKKLLRQQEALEVRYCCSIVTNLSHFSNNIEAVQNQREAFKAKINKKYFVKAVSQGFHLDNIYCMKYITKNWYLSSLVEHCFKISVAIYIIKAIGS